METNSENCWVAARSGVVVGDGVMVGVKVIVEVGSGVFVAEEVGVVVGRTGALAQATKTAAQNTQ
jgi:hypothetical protein